MADIDFSEYSFGGFYTVPSQFTVNVNPKQLSSLLQEKEKLDKFDGVPLKRTNERRYIFIPEYSRGTKWLNVKPLS